MTVSIRALRPTDAEIAYRWRNDPSIWTYTLAAGRSITVDAEIERAWIIKTAADDTAQRFAIDADGVYVGNIYLTDIVGGSAQYHVFIGERQAWGRGIASEATAQILRVAWEQLRLDRIYLYVHPDNAAGMRLYIRFGFVIVGHDRLGTQTDFVRMELNNPARCS